MTETRIIEVAIEIINQEGFANLSLKKVAKKLKIKSPSLYNHISNLEDLKNKISLYGWKLLEEKMLLSIVGESGYEAIKCMAYAFYDYATENKGIFEAMLWYNKYMTEEGNQVTHNTFDILFKILRKQNLSDETINHFIRNYICLFDYLFISP